MPKYSIKPSGRRLLDSILLATTVPVWGPKVFCVGYNKTGTTSVGAALKKLGYRHSSFNRRIWRDCYEKGQIQKVLNYTARFESFDDLPWLKEDMIPLLDDRFPGSRFIYLERDEDSWKRSFVRWTTAVSGQTPDAEAGWAGYCDHSQFIHDYFSYRPDDWITLNVRDPDGFTKLAAFLGKTAPQPGFPHKNKSHDIRKS